MNDRAFSFKDLETFFKENQEPQYRYKQTLQAIFQSPHLNFESLTNLPLGLRQKLKETFGESLLPIHLLEVKDDPQAHKYLFEFNDHERVESVYMEFQEGLRSLCVSTQVGCACKCAFCATGGIGFKRNLSAEEILAQILYVQKTTQGIDRITLMGMGEALLNPHIFEAIDYITNPKYFQLSPYRLSISSVGNIEGIRLLNEKFPQVTLTFSLHFPDQKLREQWMPTAKHYSLDKIFEVLDERAQKTNHKIYLAYMLIDGINNREKDLDALEKIFEKRGALRHLYHVNLIPFHAIPNLKLAETSKDTAIKFQKQLERRGIVATIRQSFGKSIHAACGQLAAQYQSKNGQ